MNSQWKRLLLAAMISSSVFAATWFWYHTTENKISSNGNEKPVAYVGKVIEDIQRRPSSRLLWQSIYNGEALFNGEAIRTSEKGEVRIQFAGSDRYLDLEPESLIVIKKSEGEIALDLMEGSLFVNAKAGAGGDSAEGGGLVLNSASGKVDLTGASASLSKTQGNRLDLQVLEGKASIKDKNGQSRELGKGSSGAIGAAGVQFNSSSLQILSPQVEKPVYLNADDIKPVSFQWKGFPSDAVVTLFWGDTRKDLKEIAKTTQPGASEISTRLALGKHYWKLVATNPQGQPIGESPIYRANVIARYAPTLLSPALDGEVGTRPGVPADVAFKWETSEEVRRTTLEVWSDASLKQKVATQSLDEADAYTVKGLNLGTYYWRVSGYFEDADKPILGKVQKFTVLPSNKMRDPSSVKQVQVMWEGGETSEPQLYFDKPQVKVEWKPTTEPDVATWKVTLREENGAAVATNSVPVKQNILKAPVEKPGRYIASIQALNKNGDVVGGGTERSFTIQPAPLLTGPKFISKEEILKAGNDGRADLQWDKINGAKEYQLTISKDGKELKKARYTVNSTSLKNMMPGEYQVQINAQDEHGRMSEAGETRKLLVPDSSNLKAPKLKKIKVN